MAAALPSAEVFATAEFFRPLSGLNRACSDSQSITSLPPVDSCCLAQFISRSRQAWSM